MAVLAPTKYPTALAIVIALAVFLQAVRFLTFAAFLDFFELHA